MWEQKSHTSAQTQVPGPRRVRVLCSGVWTTMLIPRSSYRDQIDAPDHVRSGGCVLLRTTTLKPMWDPNDRYEYEVEVELTDEW